MDLYFEMYSGIAGDMTIAALLDLGASKDKLIEGINSLGLSGFDLVFDRTKKNVFDAYNFDVILKMCGHHLYQIHHHDHSHSNDHSHNHKDGRDHHHNHSHDHSTDHVRRSIEA